MFRNKLLLALFAWIALLVIIVAVNTQPDTLRQTVQTILFLLIIPLAIGIILSRGLAVLADHTKLEIEDMAWPWLAYITSLMVGTALENERIFTPVSGYAFSLLVVITFGMALRIHMNRRSK